MHEKGYQVTAEFERDHWWFRARRDLVLNQLRKAISDVGAPDPLRILDYGCGTGFNLDFLAEYGAVVGADSLPERVRKYPDVLRHPFIDLNENIDSHYETFDIVTALDVIEHVDDDIRALTSIWNLLKPRGELILTAPSYKWLWSGEDVLSQHKRRYTTSRLRAAIQETDFEIAFISYFNLSILPAMAGVIWVRRILSTDAEPRSNLSRMPPLLNAVLYGITGLEDRLVGNEALWLPAGASIVCRLRKIVRDASAASRIGLRG